MARSRFEHGLYNVNPLVLANLSTFGIVCDHSFSVSHATVSSSVMSGVYLSALVFVSCRVELTNIKLSTVGSRILQDRKV